MPVAELARNWELDSVFPGIDSSEYRHSVSELKASIEALGSALKSGEAEAILAAMNAAMELAGVLYSYTQCLVTTNSKDAVAQAALSELDQAVVPLRNLRKQVSTWAAGIDLSAAQSPVVRAHQYPLRRFAEAAKHLMSPKEEELSTELALSGTAAWEKLHGNLTSQITVEAKLPDGPSKMAMSAARGLAYDGSRAVRKAAYEAELEAWKTWEVPLAACMNGIKGAVSTLSKKRGWASPLDEACWNAAIDRETLDAMLGAARESFPELRRYLKAKAKALGTGTLAFYDLFAPLGSDAGTWSHEAGAEFVERHFRAYSTRMGDFAARSYREQWIDWDPRPGKVDGAYCTEMGPNASRILMNYKPAFGSVSTLAHELGHGYHNDCLAPNSALCREIPMTVAETASIFCETIVKKAAVREGSPAERLAILEASLMGATQVVVDITSRFLFESRTFELRAQRELSPAELCDLMLDAQTQTYGDGLDSSALHAYMWAAKPHYYATESFYNFPYMFGLLFALGLYAIYEKEPDGFLEKYDLLLAETGQADAASLAARFGIDIRSGDFWRGSLAQIVEQVGQFESAVA